MEAQLDSISFFVGMAAGLVFTYLYKLIELDIRELKVKKEKEE